MPIYEFGCTQCGEVSTVMSRQYRPPSTVKCEHCGAKKTKLLISPVAIKVAYQPKYGTDFTEKTLPFLKSKFPKEFEGAGKTSDEATAFKLNEKIGTQMDRMIDKTMRRISESK